MRIPPGLLAAALALWGWRTGALPVAVPLALVIETARFVPWRWDLTGRDFNRVSDFTLLGFVVLVVVQYDAHSIRGVYQVLRWLPAVLFLLVMVQVYSTRTEFAYSALFLSVRRAVRRGKLRDPGGVDITRPYLVVCLISAAGGGGQRIAFFPAAALLLGWLLWHNRPRRYAPAAFALALGLALGLGLLGRHGVIELRRVVEPMVMEFFYERALNYRDPYRAYTAMGEIGRLKLSDRIIMRVRSGDRLPVPALLREASYQTFSKNVWLAARSEFTALPTDTEGTTWDVVAPGPRQRTVRVSRYMPRGKGLLAVPGGTFRIEDLPVEDLLRNRMGVLKVLRGPELVEYRAQFAPGVAVEPPPGAGDGTVPMELEAGLAAHLQGLGLAGLTPAAVVAGLRAHFLDDYRYSLVLRRAGRDTPPLLDFLQRTRTGHCEYFATATVMLLRAAGVPSRYVTGFAVSEWSPLEEQYVVRRRHAHSWASAWLDGRWVDVDTTPPDWGALEAAEAPWWESGYDLLSWVRLLYERWRWDTSEDDADSLLPWLTLPLLAVLLWRLFRRERVGARAGADGAARHQARRAGLDSELLVLERELAAAGHLRAPGEPLGRWLERLERASQLDGAAELRGRVLPVHYRYRFDPGGISPAERDRLRRVVADWRQRYLPPA